MAGAPCRKVSLCCCGGCGQTPPGGVCTNSPVAARREEGMVAWHSINSCPGCRLTLLILSQHSPNNVHASPDGETFLVSHNNGDSFSVQMPCVLGPILLESHCDFKLLPPTILHPHTPFQDRPMISILILVPRPLLSPTCTQYLVGSVFLFIFRYNISLQLDELSDTQIPAYKL